MHYTTVFFEHFGLFTAFMGKKKFILLQILLFIGTWHKWIWIC